MRYWSMLLLVLLAPALLGSCGSKDVAQDDDLVGPFLPPATEGVAFDVPSHPTGQYRLLRWKRLKTGNIEAVTRQDSKYGTIISVKEIDCKRRTLWHLGEGETEEQALSRKSRDQVKYLVEGSIQDVTVKVVCREVAK